MFACFCALCEESAYSAFKKNYLFSQPKIYRTRNGATNRSGITQFAEGEPKSGAHRQVRRSGECVITFASLTPLPPFISCLLPLLYFFYKIGIILKTGFFADDRNNKCKRLITRHCVINQYKIGDNPCDHTIPIVILNSASRFHR